ncbi:hypothetical protein [Nocardioides sp.]|uniref:hypothetical protein n=1 Tax=Nocardioides sp. TaxID=35761 RepID=UPI002C04177A|nr:hypothetical protein [Nocardioides sp.]HXH80731.1 hypothetical protein [Nocardioides sp.]
MRRPSIRTATATLASVLLAALASPVLPAGAAAVTAPATSREPVHQTWDSGTDWESGTSRGLDRKGGRLVVADTAPIRSIDGFDQRVGTWTSPWRRTRLVELTPSWQAYTGRGSLTIQVRVRSASGEKSSWDPVAVWGTSGRDRRTIRGHGDDVGLVHEGTWLAHDAAARLDAWQIRVRLTDLAHDASISNLWRIDAVTRASTVSTPVPSAPGPVAGRAELDAPEHSVADEPGGQRWATAAAFTMALTGAGSTSEAQRGPVAYTASKSFDNGTDAIDTFTFLTAFTSDTGLSDSWVTRLSGVAALETHLRSGDYVVVPLAHGDRPVLVVGIEVDGDVIVHDPTAPRDEEVRVVIDRSAFESDWLASGALAGIVTEQIID